MAEAVVTDAGCLIALERIGHLELLRALFGTVFAPPAVLAEFGRVLPWLVVQTPRDAGAVLPLNVRLHPGEREAIALAHERGCAIIVDELRGRTVARRLGLHVFGTAGVLVMAKEAGLVLAIAPLLDALVRARFFLSATVIQDALTAAGET